MPKRERKPASASETPPAKPKRVRKKAEKPVASDQPQSDPLQNDQAQNGQTVSEEAIRLWAYQKWVDAGKPPGEEMKFWLEAEKELSPGK